jgi:hypothetical protein
MFYARKMIEHLLGHNGEGDAADCQREYQRQVNEDADSCGYAEDNSNSQFEEMEDLIH